MAISPAHPMSLLLISLFFVPALLAIPFENCGLESYPIKVTGVEPFEEQTEASFNITGSTNKIITGGSVHLKLRLGKIPLAYKQFDLSELITCPVSPGAVVFTFHKIFSYSLSKYIKVFVTFADFNDEDIMCLDFDYRPSSGVVFA